MKKEVIIIISIILFLSIIFFIYNADQEENFEVEVIIKNLDTPWGIDFLPDNKMIFTERAGIVSTFDGSEVKIITNVEVSEISESGLLGIAVDPNFLNNNHIYLYYTSPENKNRVSRFVFENNELKEEFILIDDIPSAKFHDGGRIKFGPDEKLYITIGDARVPPSAQDLNSLSGKILRINTDGSIPEDNPFPGNPVWTYGHRNPQGIDWNNIGKLYSSEHGPRKNDELNIIVKEGNYGWPIECNEEHGEDKIKPIRCFEEFTLAPGGIAFYKNDLYIAGLRGNQLRRIIFNSDGEIIKEEALFEEFGRMREVVSYGGYLYIATSNRDGRGIPRPGDDKILMIKFK